MALGMKLHIFFHVTSNFLHNFFRIGLTKNSFADNGTLYTNNTMEFLNTFGVETRKHKWGMVAAATIDSRGFKLGHNILIIFCWYIMIYFSLFLIQNANKHSSQKMRKKLWRLSMPWLECSLTMPPIIIVQI